MERYNQGNKRLRGKKESIKMSVRSKTFTKETGKKKSKTERTGGLAFH
jgi:hypothetical protein